MILKTQNFEIIFILDQQKLQRLTENLSSLQWITEGSETFLVNREQCFRTNRQSVAHHLSPLFPHAFLEIMKSQGCFSTTRSHPILSHRHHLSPSPNTRPRRLTLPHVSHSTKPHHPSSSPNIRPHHHTRSYPSSFCISHGFVSLLTRPQHRRRRPRHLLHSIFHSTTVPVSQSLITFDLVVHSTTPPEASPSHCRLFFTRPKEHLSLYFDFFLSPFHT